MEKRKNRKLKLNSTFWMSLSSWKQKVWTVWSKVFQFFEYFSQTPLHLAASRGVEDCAKLLLQHGADVTLKNVRPNYLSKMRYWIKAFEQIFFLFFWLSLFVWLLFLEWGIPFINMNYIHFLSPLSFDRTKYAGSSFFLEELLIKAFLKFPSFSLADPYWFGKGKASFSGWSYWKLSGKRKCRRNVFSSFPSLCSYLTPLSSSC